MGLRIFRRSSMTEKRKISREEVSSKMESKKLIFSPLKHSRDIGFVDIEFRVGDQTKFLGYVVTIKGITFDEDLNILYEAELPNGTPVSIYQELLLPNSGWQEALKPIEKKPVSVPEISRISLEPASKVEPTPMINRPTTRGPLISATAIPKVMDNVVPIQDNKSKTAEISILKVSELPPTSERIDDSISEEQLESDVDSIINFIGIYEPMSELEQFKMILRAYKFLVQNSSYDKAIAEDGKSTTLHYLEETGEVATVPLVFQHLLEKVGIDIYIAVLEDKKDGVIRNIPMAKFSTISYFFDIAKERANYDKTKKEVFFSDAALGLDRYSNDYNLLGILPQDGTDGLLPLPPKISPKKLSDMIMRGYAREIPDLTYEEPEKKR